MFWARARRTYVGVTDDDEDIRRYYEVSSEFQQSGYHGVVGFIQDIGHRWVARRAGSGRVLEIGSGAGRHAAFYRGRPENFVASELASSHFAAASWSGPLRERGVRCDARRLPFAASSFDTVVSIYNLEHIADLQSVIREVHRVLVLGGQFLVALPCEGGLAWNFGRELTTRRVFQRRYGINYDKVIAYEHVWDFAGVLRELRASGCFDIERRVFLPGLLPSPHLNLIACLDCRRRDVACAIAG